MLYRSKEFNDLLGSTITDNNIPPNRIYDVDESGVGVIRDVLKVIGKESTKLLQLQAWNEVKIQP